MPEFLGFIERNGLPVVVICVVAWWLRPYIDRLLNRIISLIETLEVKLVQAVDANTANTAGHEVTHRGLDRANKTLEQLAEDQRRRSEN